MIATADSSLVVALYLTEQDFRNYPGYFAAVENERLNLGWNLKRTLAKINNRIHTDAIKAILKELCYAL